MRSSRGCGVGIGFKHGHVGVVVVLMLLTSAGRGFRVAVVDYYRDRDCNTVY
jgi:hypothetical protein